MKKILFFLVLFVIVLAGCGKKQLRTFTVINQSDWRAVVAVTISSACSFRLFLIY